MSEEGRMDSDESMDQDKSVESRKDPKLEDNSDSSRDIPNWISAVEIYVKETNVSCLQFINHSSLNNFPYEAVESILEFLPDSEVTELILQGICCSPQKMPRFCELLKRTKVETLETTRFYSSCSELLQLARGLNDTRITDWNTIINVSHLSDVHQGRELVSCLLHSPLTSLTLNVPSHVDTQALSFVEGLSNTSLTSLCIVYNSIDERPTNILVSLISQLPLCNIRDLDLPRLGISKDLIQQLSRILPDSRIEKLNLEFNKLGDDVFEVLAQGLVKSNVSVLNFQGNFVKGVNHFGYYLRNTKIKVLNIGFNRIHRFQMFALENMFKESLVEELDVSRIYFSDQVLAELIKSLKSSKILKLKLSDSPHFGTLSLQALAMVLRETGLQDVSIANIDLPLQTFDVLSGCLAESRLKRIEFMERMDSSTMSYLTFIEATKNSSVLSIDMQSTYFFTCHAETLAGALMNSTFTHLNLSSSTLGDVVYYLAVNLEHTSITDLDLSFCELEDEHIQLLAKHLRRSKIMELNLVGNSITTEGVIALKCCPQTTIIHLRLDLYNIKNNGLEILAKNFTGSLITTIHGVSRDRSRFFLIERVLVENRARSLKLVAFFKLVFPENGDGNFCFRQCIHDRDVSAFLEECLQFHKLIVEQPAVISVLLQEQSLSFSRGELRDLLENKFPQQLLEFIRDWVVADVFQQVNLLKRAEQLGLAGIVEGLLLLRPLYLINKEKGILHPLVYTLLHKYKQPICNFEVDPSSLSRITGYFKEHSDLEGAADVIKLLEPLNMV